MVVWEAIIRWKVCDNDASQLGKYKSTALNQRSRCSWYWRNHKGGYYYYYVHTSQSCYFGEFLSSEKRWRAGYLRCVTSTVGSPTDYNYICDLHRWIWRSRRALPSTRNYTPKLMFIIEGWFISCRPLLHRLVFARSWSLSKCDCREITYNYTWPINSI